MNIKLKVLPVLLIFIQNCNADCLTRKQVEQQCSGYCYEVVKPLLQYANEAQQKEITYTSLLDEINSLRESEVELKSRVGGLEKELDVYKRHNATQSALLQEYKTNRDELIAERAKYGRLVSESRKKEIEFAALQNPNSSSCPAKKTGIHEVKVHEIRNFPVFCDSESVDSGWTVIQRRQDASVSFERGWTDYRKGFGDLQGNFFIGLEKLYLITNERPHELYIQLTSVNNESRFARYNHFKIGDESELYKIKSIGEYSGDAGDSLSEHHLGMKFSTYDQDNDESPYNCAEEWLSGWWYKNCAEVNLNGLYRDDKVNFQSGIKWNSWDEKIQLTFVQIMIKPIVS